VDDDGRKQIGQHRALSMVIFFILEFFFIYLDGNMKYFDKVCVGYTDSICQRFRCGPACTGPGSPEVSENIEGAESPEVLGVLEF
jgi:hypothetical protein